MTAKTGGEGLAGAAKRLIKGAFSFRFTKTTEIITPEFETFGVESKLDSDGAGLRSVMIRTGVGIVSGLSSSAGVASEILTTGSSVKSKMITTGLGVKSAIT